MALITISEYAAMHDKDPKTIEYHIRAKKLTYVKKYGKRLIDSRTKYPKDGRI